MAGMTILIEDADALLESLCALPREADWVEFKQNQFDADSVGQYISALANSAMFHEKDHAYLVFGVRNADHEVVGTSVNIENERVGEDRFLFWLSKYLDPRVTVQHHRMLYKGKNVVILCIDPVYQKPVKFKRIAYIRVDASQQPLSNHSEIERALWQITSRYSFEATIIQANATADDVKNNFDYEKLLELMGKQFKTMDRVLNYMGQLDLVSANLQGRYDVTALCGMACAERMNDFSLLKDKAPRVITYKGTSKIDAIDDRDGVKGYAASFEGMLEYIMYRIPHDEVMRHGIRTTVYRIPELTVREFVANAIIHQDFTDDGGRPVIEIYSDKIKIINPGEPLIEPDRFIDSPSKTRNPRFASLMRAAGLCEQRGSGVDRALAEIEKESLPPPLIQAVEGSTSVTVFMNKRFAELSTEDRVRACYQHACLRYERSDNMSNGSLRSRFGLKPAQYPQVSIVIRDAIDAGRIRPLAEDQPNRNARYVPYWA